MDHDHRETNVPELEKVGRRPARILPAPAYG